MKIKIVFPVLIVIFFSFAGIVSSNNIDDVRKIIHLWSNAWQSRDIKHYMSFYGPDFKSKGYDYKSWEIRKADIFQKVNFIKVEISDLWVFIEGKVATVTFIQKYRDSRVADIGKKKLILIDPGKKWKIISEEWESLEIPRVSYGISFPSLHTKREKKSIKNFFQDHRHKSLSPDKIIIKNIKCRLNKDNETIFVFFNSFIPPKVFSLEGERPRIVMDVRNIYSWNGPFKIPVQGKLIKMIRTYYDRKTGKLRIVLDLNPAENYSVDQILYKDKNIFSITVR